MANEPPSNSRAAYIRDLRQRSPLAKAQLRITSRKQTLATQWIQRNRPDIWEQITDQAYNEVGVERRPHKPRTQP